MSELLVNALDGSGPTVLFGGDENIFYQQPALSPNGGCLAYVKHDFAADETTIRVCQPDGSSDTVVYTIADGSTLNTPSPAWHPDSNLIVFTGSPSYLYTVEPDGANLTSLNPIFGAWPLFSPDGQYIARSLAPGALATTLPQLRRCDADGANDIQITLSSNSTSPNSARTFSWLHGSNVIVYGETTSGRQHFKINSDGTGKTALSTTTFNTSSNPILTKQCVSSDDSVAVGAKSAGSLGWQLYLIPLDGSGPVAISPSQYHPGYTGTLPMIFDDRIYWVQGFLSGHVGTGGRYGDFQSMALDGSDVRVEYANPDICGTI